MKNYWETFDLSPVMLKSTERKKMNSVLNECINGVGLSIISLPKVVLLGLFLAIGQNLLNCLLCTYTVISGIRI